MKDDFLIPEQDLEDSDDTGWYQDATWIVYLGELVFQYQLLTISHKPHL